MSFTEWYTWLDLPAHTSTITQYTIIAHLKFVIHGSETEIHLLTSDTHQLNQLH